MTLVTVTGAAKLARVSRGTIYNKIESGELSKGPEGIDTAELLRVFGTLHDVSNDDKSASGDNVSDAKAKTTAVMARQNDEITQKLLEQLEEAASEKEWLREMLEKKESQLADRQRRLDEQIERHADERKNWAHQIESAQKLLPAPPNETELRPMKLTEAFRLWRQGARMAFTK